jgi:hypothetical protein
VHPVHQMLNPSTVLFWFSPTGIHQQQGAGMQSLNANAHSVQPCPCLPFPLVGHYRGWRDAAAPSFRR